MRTWRDIDGYEGRYQVSDDGHVRSLPEIDQRGQFMPGIILRPATNEKGYLRVVLSDKSHKVHRLVAKAFIPNPENLPQVNHKDGNKANCRKDNLEWVTNSQNQTHRYRVLGHVSGLLGKTGLKCANSKPIFCCAVDGSDYRKFGGASEAARVLGVSASGISMAARGALQSFKGYRFEYITREQYDSL